MPSIADLFAVSGDSQGKPLDPAALDAATQSIFADRTPPAEPPPAAAAPPAEPPAPPPAQPPAPVFSAEEAEVALIRQAMADPLRADAIRRAYLGVEAPPPAAPPPPPPPAALLPDHVDPQSFEAELWRDNQELRRQMADFQARTEERERTTDQQMWAREAEAAGAEFATRYAGRLSPDEFRAIAVTAGARGLPRALEQVYGPGSTRRACVEAMEFVLRSEPALLSKVLGGAQGGVADTGAPAPAPPVGQVPGLSPMVPAFGPSAEDRKRTLSALSAASSPVGEPPVRTPIEHRPDGRLAEASRRSIVDQLAASLRQPE